MPEPYAGSVTSQHDRTKLWSIIQAATYFDLPPLIDRVGDWAICTDGLHCLTTSYQISADRLQEADWPDHVARKNWANVGEFESALSKARLLRELGYLQ
jgi:hypothetical protein